MATPSSPRLVSQNFTCTDEIHIILQMSPRWHDRPTTVVVTLNLYRRCLGLSYRQADRPVMILPIHELKTCQALLPEVIELLALMLAGWYVTESNQLISAGLVGGGSLILVVS